MSEQCDRQSAPMIYKKTDGTLIEIFPSLTVCLFPGGIQILSYHSPDDAEAREWVEAFNSGNHSNQKT